MLRLQSTLLGCFLALAGIAKSHVLPVLQVKVNDTAATAAMTELKPLLLPGLTTPLLGRDDMNPADFSWVHRWAAVGDSYTAGIGSGRQLGGVFHNQDDWLCSRYDTSYPMIANQAFGSAVDDFQFVACSGDRSVQIYDQVQAMEGSLDLVLMTAGGNDLCLASMLKVCVFLPFQGEDKCQAVIDQATSNIQNIIKPNVRQILAALNSKMGKDSIVVYNGYAQFFNTANDDCTNNQNWSLIAKWFNRGLQLTIDRRQKFNDLVVALNSAIKDVVDEFSAKDGLNYKIDFANWDRWPREGVTGQFCDPSSSGHYPDDSQPDLQFFKTDTYVVVPIHDELKKRRSDGSELSEEEIEQEEEREFQEFVARLNRDINIYDSVLFKSVDPRAEALHKLDPRQPAPPNCPGDGSFDPTLGLGLPDTFGKLFHPNELGHNTIASYALQTVMDLRADILGVTAPVCEITDQFTCYQRQGRRAYAHPDMTNNAYKDFCPNVVVPSNTAGWSYSKTYYEGTPDEQVLKIQLGDASSYDQNQCMESMDRIINSCDGNDPNNPMDWKFGGEWKRGEYTYSVSPSRDNRPWPPIKATHGTCKGWYKVFYSEYTVEGAGFATFDYGQQTLLRSLRGCMGSGITKWTFDYYDPPTPDGLEWKAKFRTPIWVRQRCMNNNKVQQAAGGFTDGCGGND